MGKYTMKDIHECISDIGCAESTIFMTLDLTSGFWQISLHANSVPKTAFTLPGLGQYEWLMSPMGLVCCPASLQRLMEKLMDKLMDKIKNIIMYIEDLLIHSQTYEQHFNSLELVMQRQEEKNIKNNLSKCFLKALK
jgi:cleavage and polyadenylation specificity factor subunit 1